MNINLQGIINFFSNRNLHKLAGTALASVGLAGSNWKDLTVGAAYAAVMHVVGGIKKVAE